MPFVQHWHTLTDWCGNAWRRTRAREREGREGERERERGGDASLQSCIPRERHPAGEVRGCDQLMFTSIRHNPQLAGPRWVGTSPQQTSTCDAGQRKTVGRLNFVDSRAQRPHLSLTLCASVYWYWQRCPLASMANIPSLYDAIGWRTPGGMPADASVGILPQIEPQKT